MDGGARRKNPRPQDWHCDVSGSSCFTDLLPPMQKMREVPANAANRKVRIFS